MVSESTGLKIPTIAARGLVFTAWCPSEEEVASLKAGAILWLVQRGSCIPEMSMIVGRQEDVIPRDMQLEALEDVSPDRQRMLEELGERKEAILKRARMFDVALYSVVALMMGWGLGCLLKALFHG